MTYSKIERSSCAVGVVYNPNKRNIGWVLDTLAKLPHRGGQIFTINEGETVRVGDGAGVSCSIDWQYYDGVIENFEIEKPSDKVCAIGNFFLPVDIEDREKSYRKIQEICEKYGVDILSGKKGAWREIPFTSDDSENAKNLKLQKFQQCFLSPKEAMDQSAFEKVLLEIHREIEQYSLELDLECKAEGKKPAKLAVASISSEEVIYKGMLLPHEVAFFEDLKKSNPTKVAYHIRQSTNVSPSPGNSQPFRLIGHNGELNSIDGNVYKRHKPARGFSDSRSFDDHLRDLILEGHDIIEAIRILMPPLPTGDPELDAMTKDMKLRGLEYNGPAHMVFSHGNIRGALLDSNALRPSRYLITEDEYGVKGLYVGSEDMLSEANLKQMRLKVVERGMLRAGEMIIIEGNEIKKHVQILQELAARYKPTKIDLVEIKAEALEELPGKKEYGEEELEIRKYQLLPLFQGHAKKMAMGNDTPQLRSEGNYTIKLSEQFAQKFSQVSSPPIDSRAERESFDLTAYLGDRDSQRLLRVDSPLLKLGEFEKIQEQSGDEIYTADLTFELTPDIADEEELLKRMQQQVVDICLEVERQVRAGKSIVVLDCSNMSKQRIALPDILVTAAVYSHLYKQNLEKKASIIVNSAQMDSAHHFSTLSALGAAAVNPVGAYNFAIDLAKGDALEYAKLCDNFRQAVSEAHMLTMGKYGITSADVYHASRLVETITLNLKEGEKEEYNLVSLYHAFHNVQMPDGFNGKLGVRDLLSNAVFEHAKIYGEAIFTSGRFAYKTDGIAHTYNPGVVRAVRDATNEYRTKRQLVETYSRLSQVVEEESEREFEDFQGYKTSLSQEFEKNKKIITETDRQITALRNEQERLVNSLFFVEGIAKELDRIAEAHRQKTKDSSSDDMEDIAGKAEYEPAEFSLNEISIRSFLSVVENADERSLTRAFKEYKSGLILLAELKEIIFTKAGYDASEMDKIEQWALLTTEGKALEAAAIFLALNPKNQARIKYVNEQHAANEKKISDLEIEKSRAESEKTKSALLLGIAQKVKDAASYKIALKQEAESFREKSKQFDLLPTVTDGRFDAEEIRKRPVDDVFKKSMAEIKENKSRSPVTIADHIDLKLDGCEALEDRSHLQPVDDIAANVFVTGGMSHGALTLPAHKDIAKSAQLLGGNACTGEGGKPAGEIAKSVQVASGRFGLDPDYFADADVIEIKVVQGAKPGQGGMLGAEKVTVIISAQRQSPVGVSLTSPPPHHDIYSIEDLQELIHDLKELKPGVKVAVKVCASTGIGEIAKGLAKSGCDIINIAGVSGGTGAAEVDAIKSTGLPSEIGLIIANQALLEAGIRDVVKLQVSGFPFTPEGVIKMAILGGDIFESGTFDLMLLGCDMHRKCNIPGACGPGITNNEEGYQGHAQDLALYKLNMSRAVQDLMAQIGVNNLKELRGRTDLLSCELLQGKVSEEFIKTLMDGNQHLDKQVPDHLLEEYRQNANRGTNIAQYQQIETALAEAAKGEVKAEFDVGELEVTNRTFGATVAFQYRDDLQKPEHDADHITIKTKGSAGQSYGAFNLRGLCLEHTGSVQDGFGKSMSGGVLVVKQPPSETALKDSVYVGNAALYGAMGGKAFLPSAGSRFAILMKGATAVVNGNVGDRACSYMTSGSVLILGQVGSNFAGSMIGGIAVVYDDKQTLKENSDIRFAQADEAKDYYEAIKALLEEDVARTGSERAKEILQNFEANKANFKIVIPKTLDKITTLEELEKNEQAFALRYAARKFGVENSVSPFEKCWFRAKRKQLEQQQVKVVSPSKKEQQEVEGLSESFKGIATHQADKMRRYGAMATRVVGGLGVPDQVLSDDVSELMEELFDHGKKCSCDAVTCTKSEEKVADKHTSSGCPIAKNPNLINGILKDATLTEEERARKAFQMQIAQSPFAGFTGLACPAPCQDSCTHSASDAGNAEAVKIKRIELLLHRIALKSGWYDELGVFAPRKSNGKKAMIIGSGPSSLEAAYHLALAGVQVEIFEKSDQIGGLLRYGIPDHKLQKETIDFYVEKLKAMGIKFHVNSEINIETVQSDHPGYNLYLDARGVAQTPIPFDERFNQTAVDKGHSMAMDFLTYCNKFHNSVELGHPIAHPFELFALHGKTVAVIGAGDTAEDVKRSILKLNAYLLPTAGKVKIVTIDRQPQKADRSAIGSNYPHARERVSDELHQELTHQQHHDAVSEKYETTPQEFVVDDNGNIKGVKVNETYVVNREYSRSHRSKPTDLSTGVVECDFAITAVGFKAPAINTATVKEYSQVANGAIVAIGDVATKSKITPGLELIVSAQASGKEAVLKFLGVHNHEDEKKPSVSMLRKSFEQLMDGRQAQRVQ